MQLSLHPNQTLEASFLNPQPQHCLSNCAEELTKWYTMKLDRDLCQCGQNCQADREGRRTGQKKQGTLASAMHVLKTNTKTTSLLLFSCTQTWRNLCERGGLNRANKNMENRGEKKCKGNGSILTIWAEVIYQNDLLDEAGRSAVQDAAGIQRGKRQSLWVAKVMAMVGLTQACCAMRYSRNNKHQWQT